MQNDNNLDHDNVSMHEMNLKQLDPVDSNNDSNNDNNNNSNNNNNNNNNSNNNNGNNTGGYGTTTTTTFVNNMTTTNGSSLIQRFLAFIKGLDESETMLFHMLIGVVSAFIIGGIVISQTNNNIPDAVISILSFPGTLFLNALKLLVMPLIFVSMILSVANLGQVAERGRIAKLTFSFYIGTTLLSSLLGALLVMTINPGSFASPQTVSSSDAANANDEPMSVLDSFLNIFYSALPPNIVLAASQYNILAILVFALWFGYTLSKPSKDNTITEEKIQMLFDILQVIYDVVIRMVSTVLSYAPFGVFSLILSRMVGTANFGSEMASLGMYLTTVLLGLFLQSVLILPFLYWIITKRNPLPLIRSSYPAYAFALGTGSSTATVPISISCSNNYGVHNDISQFVIPLGSTVNMNGTALYEAVACIYIGQVYGFHFNFLKIFIIIFTSSIAAAGAAGIPQAGLVTMLIVLNAANLPLEGISIILAVDWFLDRFRTVINIMGDLYAAATVNHLVNQYTRISSDSRHA